MYKVSIGGVEKEIEAKAVSIENGNIIFFSDIEKSLVDFVVSANKWDSLAVCEGSEPLKLARNVPVQPKEENAVEAPLNEKEE